MRKALVVGINFYRDISPLYGCVADAHAVKAMLERHGDGSVNFGCKSLIGVDESSAITRSILRDSIKALFEDDSEIALLFFAGHGYIESTGGFLCSSDCYRGDDGVSLSDVVTLANQSPARNKVIVLDSCHSGVTGDHPKSGSAELVEGMTILTASTAEQYASEANGSGIFTSLFVDALGGAAANLVGDVTPGGVYAHIDQALGPWAQRPVFKTNVKTFVSLRKVNPPVLLSDLRRITELFPGPGFELQLDPSFEPESPAPNPRNTAIFAILQSFNHVNLVVPVGAQHMWHAAMQSKACKLTALGEHYRKLSEKNLL